MQYNAIDRWKKRTARGMAMSGTLLKILTVVKQHVQTRMRAQIV